VAPIREQGGASTLPNKPRTTIRKDDFKRLGFLPESGFHSALAFIMRAMMCRNVLLDFYGQPPRAAAC
jgi:hypothetical protein